LEEALYCTLHGFSLAGWAWALRYCEMETGYGQIQHRCQAARA
jgi:hypothetical protein